MNFNLSEKEEEKQNSEDSDAEDVNPTIIESADKEIVSNVPPNKEIVSYFLQFNCFNCQTPIVLKSDSPSLKIKCPNCKKINVLK